MPNYLKQIIHTQFFSAFSIIIGFGTLLILIKYMPISDYGEYILIQGFISIAGLFFSQNLYVYSRLHIPGAELLKQYAYLKTVIMIVMGLYLFFIALIKVLEIELAIFNFFELSNSFIYIVLTMLGFHLINHELMRFFIATKNINLNNYAQFFQKVFIFIAIVFLIYIDSLTLDKFLYFFIFGQVLVFLYLLYYINIIELCKSKFMLDVLKKGYRIALPLLPVGLMSIALNYTDTIMISKFIDKEHVAQYGFASQIVNIAMMMIGSSIVMTLFAYATEAHNTNNTRLRTSFFIKMYGFGAYLGLLFYLLSTINAEWVIAFLRLEGYTDVATYLSVLAIFPLFQLLYNVSSHHLQLIKIYKIQVLFSIFVMAENIVLNYFMIQSYGVMGAAYASLLSFVTLSILYLGVSFVYDSNLIKAIKDYILHIFIIPIVILVFYYIYVTQALSLNSLYIIFGNILAVTIAGLYFIYSKKRKLI